MKPKGDFEPWVYKAEEDYRTAVTMVRKRKGGAPDVVCFCSHQCIEKYLKAFLVLHRIPFRKIHVLDALLDLAVTCDLLLEVIRRNVVKLNPYAVRVRYPGDEATIGEARDAVVLMKRLRAFLREKLELPKQT